MDDEFQDSPETEDIEIRPGSGMFAPDEYLQVVKWIKRGMFRNEIARRTGRGVATITRVAHKEGLSFAGANLTAPATEMQSLNARATRRLLADKFQEAAFNALEEINARRGPKKRLTSGDKRNLMIVAGIAADKHVSLTQMDSPEEGKQGIIAFFDSLHVAVVRDAPREVMHGRELDRHMEDEPDRDSGS